MLLQQFRALIAQSQQPKVLILSDGYGYLIQVQLQHSLQILSDDRGSVMQFRNLGDAEAALRQLGIRHASLQQIVPHDEMVSPGASSLEPATSHMPLRF